MKKSEIFFGLFRIPIDFVMTLLAFLTAYKLRTFTGLIPGIKLPLDLTTFPETTGYLKISAIASVLLLGIFAVNEMYSLKITSSLGKEIKKIVILSAAWLMIIIAYFFLTRQFPFSRLVLGYTFLLTILYVGVGRSIIRTVQYILLKKGIGRRRVAVIGESKFSKEITKTIEKNVRYKLVGFITENPPTENSPNFLGIIENLEQMMKEKNIEEIIQTESNLNKLKNAQIVQLCRQNHIAYSFIPDLLEIERSNVEVTTLGKIPLIRLKPTPLDGWGKVWKRITDIIGATTGLIITGPLLVISAMAIKWDSKGPILFSKLDNGKPVRRVGQRGKLFKCYKLRTMQDRTHAKRLELLDQNMRKNSPFIKIEKDPRITRIGKFLRRSSIDEIPQFWSVIKGDMSLVGPRPHYPEEVEKYNRDQHFVLEVKPGITGLAQVNGRSDLTFEKEMEYDTYYIQNWSPWLDFKIMIKTIRAVVKGYKE